VDQYISISHFLLHDLDAGVLVRVGSYYCILTARTVLPSKKAARNIIVTFSVIPDGKSGDHVIVATGLTPEV